MSEYRRGPRDGIQAGLALNAGRLLVQYMRITECMDASAKYEATLTLCVLQTMLATCQELLKTLSKFDRSPFRTPLGRSTQWGLQDFFVTENSFPGPVRVERVVEHLRNALSHPTTADLGSLRATGYTTREDGSRLVTEFLLTDSPWVKRGVLKCYRGALEASKSMASFERRYGSDFRLAIGRQHDGSYVVTRDEAPYVPVFQMRIPLPAMMEFARQLANYLAQPVEDDWDGTNVKPLVA